MPVNESLLRPCLELIVDPLWWYTQAARYYAEAFWAVGGGDLIIQTIETVLLDCTVPRRDEGLSRVLAGVYPAPHDQYRLTVSLATSALWHHGHADKLLQALQDLTSSHR